MRELVDRVIRDFDGDVVLALLSRVAGHGLDTQTVGAVTHARLTIESGWKTSAEVATARFALARVVTLLEQHVRGRLRVVE